MSTLTALSQCGVINNPFTATAMEPLRWDSRKTYYDASARPILDEFFMDEKLQFRHVYTYDDVENTVTIQIS